MTYRISVGSSYNGRGSASAEFDIVEREIDGRALGYVAAGFITNVPVRKMNQDGMSIYKGQREVRKKFEIPLTKISTKKVGRKVARTLTATYVL